MEPSTKEHMTNLRSRTLANGDDSVLFRVQDAALFRHRLRVSDRCAEMAVPVKTAV